MNQEKRLESWKEIETYLKRDVRTLRRWEKEEGLPIHRHSHKIRSSVYAYPSEIDAWRLSRKVVAEPAPAPVSTLWRVPTFALAILLCLIMAGNGVRPQTVSAKDGPVAKRLVCSDCGDSEGNLSQDGRSLIYTDWNTGDLVIRDMKTGKVKRLMAKPGEWGDGAYAEAPVFSADARQIVYDWYLGKNEGSHDQFRIMPNEPGGKSRVLVNNADDIYYETAGWFPDGKSVLVTIQKTDKTSLLARVALSDGAVIVLKQLGWRTWKAGSARLSPDGRYIAYSVLAVNPSKVPPAPSDPKDVHIYLLAADGSSETEIVKTAGINQDQMWTADGKHLLFISDRAGKNGLWSIAVRDGKAAGEPSLVSSEIGDIDVFSIAGNSLVYYQTVQNDLVHVAKLGPGGAQETQSFTGVGPAWSPDGKSVAFKRRLPGSTSAYELVVHAVETGDERVYLSSLGTTGSGDPIWFHDGAALMTGVGHGTGDGKFYRINVKSREFKELPARPQRRAISPDDETLYEVLPAPDGKAPDRVVAIDLATGQQRAVFASSAERVPNSVVGRLALALSPDGQTLALTWRSRDEHVHVARVAVDGRGFREVFTATGPFNGGTCVVWDREGRSILFDQEQPGGSRWAVMRVPADGGQATALFSAPHRIQWFDLSPDGTNVAYGVNEHAHELWALDNVLPALK